MQRGREAGALGLVRFLSKEDQHGILVTCPQPSGSESAIPRLLQSSEENWLTPLAFPDVSVNRSILRRKGCNRCICMFDGM